MIQVNLNVNKVPQLLVPEAFILKQNYPNPFNSSTTIQYGLPSRSRVTIKIYNLLGQSIMEFACGEQNAGYQSVVWNTRVATGIYFYRIEAVDLDNPGKQFIDVKKMLLLK